MNPILRNILATIGGMVLGNAVNMATLIMGSKLIAPPEGVDPMDPVSIAENIDKFTAINFLTPFLAHALGTLIASFVICRFVTTKERVFALVVGIVFFLSGVAVNQMIPGPLWFTVVDLTFAYIPMALLGYFLAMNAKKKAKA